MPLYPRSKQVLLSLALSFPLVSCGDGGTDPADLILIPDFKIELVFINRGTPSQDSVFIAAADRWMGVLQGELDDVDFSSNPVAANTPSRPQARCALQQLRGFWRDRSPGA